MLKKTSNCFRTCNTKHVYIHMELPRIVISFLRWHQCFILFILNFGAEEYTLVELHVSDVHFVGKIKVIGFR